LRLLSRTQIRDFSDKRVLIPLSGGVNSMAVLCFLGEEFPDEYKPKELFMYYSHLVEHSPDTLRFVRDGVQYAKRRFENVTFGFNIASVNEFFVEQKMIPHPTISPCSRELKMRLLDAFYEANGCDVRLIGYVSHEVKTRFERAKRYVMDSFEYPILEFTEADCFEIVDRVIGWHPAIYDIQENGKRVFTHNNCLPCKNMSLKQLQAVGRYFPQYARKAERTAAAIPGAYWGRDDVPEVFKCDVCERI
jgi:3'-phosphoadenosine 5'-phosphosulfate sulfotransferase (PAPS reductase)/FAD synthetase